MCKRKNLFLNEKEMSTFWRLLGFPGGSEIKESFWRKKWQHTPVFLPGESHGWRSLMGYSPRGCKESDATKQLHFHFTFIFKIRRLSQIIHLESESSSALSDSLWPVLQARILESVAFPFSRGSSQPRDQTQVSYIAGRFFTSWATREALFMQRWVQ